jgi:hypothetical protein
MDVEAVTDLRPEGRGGEVPSSGPRMCSRTGESAKGSNSSGSSLIGDRGSEKTSTSGLPMRDPEFDPDAECASECDDDRAWLLPCACVCAVRSVDVSAAKVCARPCSSTKTRVSSSVGPRAREEAESAGEGAEEEPEGPALVLLLLLLLMLGARGDGAGDTLGDRRGDSRPERARDMGDGAERWCWWWFWFSGLLWGRGAGARYSGCDASIIRASGCRSVGGRDRVSWCRAS